MTSFEGEGGDAARDSILNLLNLSFHRESMVQHQQEVKILKLQFRKISVPKCIDLIVTYTQVAVKAIGVNVITTQNTKNKKENKESLSGERTRRNVRRRLWRNQEYSICGSQGTKIFQEERNDIVKCCMQFDTDDCCEKAIEFCDYNSFSLSKQF